MRSCYSGDSYLVAGTDGVGTKLKLAFEMEKHDTIGIDLVAMCANDVVVCGAKPLFFLDYYATGKLDVDVAEQVVKGINAACVEIGALLLGGETAEMPGMYSRGEYDVAGKILPPRSMWMPPQSPGLIVAALRAIALLPRHCYEHWSWLKRSTSVPQLPACEPAQRLENHHSRHLLHSPPQTHKNSATAAGFAVGSVKKSEVVTGEDIAPGDVLIGMPSTGVHSNGFSLVRKVTPPSNYATATCALSRGRFVPYAHAFSSLAPGSARAASHGPA